MNEMRQRGRSWYLTCLCLLSLCRYDPFLTFTNVPLCRSAHHATCLTVSMLCYVFVGEFFSLMKLRMKVITSHIHYMERKVIYGNYRSPSHKADKSAEKKRFRDDFARLMIEWQSDSWIKKFISQSIFRFTTWNRKTKVKWKGENASGCRSEKKSNFN